jgi:hypothetical protein
VNYLAAYKKTELPSRLEMFLWWDGEIKGKRETVAHGLGKFFFILSLLSGVSDPPVLTDRNVGLWY